MGFLDRLFGRKDQQQAPTSYPQQAPQGQPQAAGWQQQPAPASYQQPPQQQPADADQQAVQRYEYLLRTAPPEQIEKAHEQAFAQLTPAQRQQVLNKLAQAAPQDAPRDDSPASLARSATRAEMQQPGTLQRAFGGPGLGGRAGGAGLGMGGMLLTSVAGAFIGTAIAQEMFDNDVQSDASLDDSANPDNQDSGDGGQDAGQAPGADAAGADTAAYDGGADQGLSADSGADSGFDGGGFDGGGFDGGDFGGGFDF
ncbi:hypothetical protein [Luteipulveratus halotolerans]|uniref:Uncharacterized protein n=1 Tax=Luteipulveratus halotolerans TaxID=1631356 RepID=A0A0L6CFY2_9MICO|nr:hypothetical protein [Luteipulveratus halotolerans]KNX36614.1 hypothetical protein VV01_04735 [Luteipulveratus halotolerans]